MSAAALRTVAKHTTRITRTAGIRSPFAVLTAGEHSSPLSSSTAASAHLSPIHVYEKQDGYHMTHPEVSSGGQRVYVVSQPDPQSTPYEVPYGAYPTSAPYVNFPITDAPPSGQRASTSPNFAHPATTRGDSELASRNPQPDDARVAEKFSSLGVDNAWKARK